MRNTVVEMMRTGQMAVGDTLFLQLGAAKHECRIGDAAGTIVALPSMTAHSTLRKWISALEPARPAAWARTKSSAVTHERSGKSITAFQRAARKSDNPPAGAKRQRKAADTDVAAITSALLAIEEICAKTRREINVALTRDEKMKKRTRINVPKKVAPAVEEKEEEDSGPNMMDLDVGDADDSPDMMGLDIPDV